MKNRTGAQQHTLRCRDGRYASIRLTRKLAMACMCVECLGWETSPEDCTSLFCPLYPYRCKTLRTQKGTMATPNG